MHGRRGIFLLTYMVAVAIPVSLSFNIETTNPSVYTGEQQSFFGYKVLPFMFGTNKGIIVTAPLQKNGSGEVCKRGQNLDPTCFNLKDITVKNKRIPVKHFGLSIAGDSTGSHFTVCSPNVAHECYENSYLNSVCYNMTYDLLNVASFTPLFQACTKKTVDLVFLFDGSQSMTEAEFNKNKDFIVDIINSLKNSSIKFAAVQFSTIHRKVFDFNDYQAGTALDKLQKEPHMKGLTNTHKALKFVLEDIFLKPEAGASSDATKVLVVITDGDPSDSDRHKIIKRYNETNIIRFVIGVKDAKMEKFTVIASQPTEKYAFKIENYDGLTGVLGNFQKKIFKMEGTKVAQAGDLTDEMSQSGFSAATYKDTLILGSVGSDNWRGSLQEITEQNERSIKVPDMQNDSYIGYSVSVGEKNNAPVYFTGAPRFNYTGQVILFTYKDNKWTTTQRINGSQIGSYFGAELCSIDINSDGNTDFLLVGAPLFYHPQEKREGLISIYILTDEMQLDSKPNVPAPSMGRFGTAISSLADLNGDGLRDVAVGAPLEDDNSGVVYIFLGDTHRGIRSTFSQRIMGQKINPGLRFFGQAINGDIDLGEDGLPDIVIGSQGMAVVLRSRPVFNVTSHLSFEPNEINTDRFGCSSNTDGIFPMVTFTVCFEMVETTKSIAGAMSSGLNISYTLDIDPMRQTFRGFFSDTDRKARNRISACELRDKKTCFNYSIYMPECVKDTLSPLSIKLNFSQADIENASAVLNVDSKRQAVVEIPFKKHCTKNDTCIGDLEVDFNFMTPTLLVAEGNYINVSIELSNHGDDSYNTSLTMHYPQGLSFSMMILTKATRSTLHNCQDLEGVFDKTVCGISRPVYRSRSSATFKTSFYILTDREWNDTISMTITGNSDNNNSTRNNSMTKYIPVQFEIKMAVTASGDTITYLNFTTEDSGPKKVDITYKIINDGWKAFPVSVSLVFPPKLDHNFEMMNYQVFVEKNKTQCNNKPEACSPQKYIITCDTFILDKYSSTEFKLSGDVQFTDLKQHAANIAFLKRYTGESAEVKFKSFIRVSYDEERYVLDSHKKENKGVTQRKSTGVCLWNDSGPTVKSTEIRVEFIIHADQRLIISTGVGMGLLLLIIITVIMFKMGCFKRKKLPEDEDDEEFSFQVAPLSESAPSPTKETVNQSDTDSKSEQPAEEKNLLDDNEANGSAPLADAKEGLD